MRISSSTGLSTTDDRLFTSLNSILNQIKALSAVSYDSLKRICEKELDAKGGDDALRTSCLQDLLSKARKVLYFLQNL